MYGTGHGMGHTITTNTPVEKLEEKLAYKLVPEDIAVCLPPDRKARHLLTTLGNSRAAAKGAAITCEVVLRVADLEDFAARHAADYRPGGAFELLRKEAVNVTASIHLNSGARWSIPDMRKFNDAIYTEHNQATVTTRKRLNEKWSAATLLGKEIEVWSLLQLLHFTVDHSDGLLFYTSQFIHSLQVYEGVTRTHFDETTNDPAYKRDMRLAALIHDIGKLLALIGNEADANVDCMNRVIPGSLPLTGPPIGLSNIPVQWNHDEYGEACLVLFAT